MNPLQMKTSRRIFAVLAWLIFLCGAAALITGIFVGNPSSSIAQEDPGETAAVEETSETDSVESEETEPEETEPTEPSAEDDASPDTGESESDETSGPPAEEESETTDGDSQADDAESETEDGAEPEETPEGGETESDSEDGTESEETSDGTEDSDTESEDGTQPEDGADDATADSDESDNGAGGESEEASGDAEDAAEDSGAGDETESADTEQGTEQQETISLNEMEGDTPFHQRAISFLGIFVLLFFAWLLSNNRAKINWRLVGIGISLQLGFAVFIFFTPWGEPIFQVATEAFTQLLQFTDDGSEFIFESFVTQEWEPGLRNFAFAVLPTIIFFSSLMTILYHLGVMQKLVHGFALIMQKTMNLSGAESTSAAANIFVGQTEAPLVVKPFVEDMTTSELAVVMTGGFATVAGGVLAIYVGMLNATFPDIAGHLIAASVMSAPAAVVVAKIMYPETGNPVTMGKLEVHDLQQDVNVLDAASRGAAEGLKLALNVGAMLLAFIALIAMINYLLGLPSLLYNKNVVLPELINYFNTHGMTIPEGCAAEAVADEDLQGCIQQMQGAAGGAASEAWVAPSITMQGIFEYVFWPFAFVMGVPVEDCSTIARLLGEKMVINELVAYASLQQLLLDSEVVLQKRSVIIATYALCGFANFGSIGIQLGGIGGIAPSRKQDLARIALKAMIGGTIAAFMTATIAGILV